MPHDASPVPTLTGARALAGATKTARGGWKLQASYTYFLDRGLVSEIGKIVAGATVLELGAGEAEYSQSVAE